MGCVAVAVALSGISVLIAQRVSQGEMVTVSVSSVANLLGVDTEASGDVDDLLDTFLEPLHLILGFR